MPIEDAQNRTRPGPEASLTHSLPVYSSMVHWRLNRIWLYSRACLRIYLDLSIMPSDNGTRDPDKTFCRRLISRPSRGPASALVHCGLSLYWLQHDNYPLSSAWILEQDEVEDRWGNTNHNTPNSQPRTCKIPNRPPAISEQTPPTRRGSPALQTNYWRWYFASLSGLNPMISLTHLIDGDESLYRHSAIAWLSCPKCVTRTSKVRLDCTKTWK